MLRSASPYGIPESCHMIPGKTYFGILPGHARPAFVRRRPVDAGRPPLLLTQIFGSSRRAYCVEAPRKPSMFCRSRSDVYYDYATAKYRPKVYVDQSPGRTITSIQQTCASCGKFRSARWQSRHPLVPGTACRPGLCGKCRDQHTSSEEERPRSRRRRLHNRRHDCTDSTEDIYDTSTEPRRPARRHRSYSQDYVRRSRAKSPSRQNVRIIIANQAGDRIRPERKTSRSSSEEPIRVIRRTEVVNLPERPPRSRSRLRSSSRAEYVDSANQYIEDLDPPRYLPRPRTLSRVSYFEDVKEPRNSSRPRSLSHVTYVEELERPKSRPKPRSVSRVSYIEDLDPPRSRRHARSSSQVRFVDETDEPVSPSKPRSLKRRRVVYYDGAADTENSEKQALIRTPSTNRSLQGAVTTANVDSGAVLIEEPMTPHSSASRKAVEHGRGIAPIGERFEPRRRPSSEFQEDLSPISGTGSDHYYKEPSMRGSFTHESDHNATPRPAFHHAQVIQSPDDVEEPPSHHSLCMDFDGARFYRRFYSPALESRKPSRQRMSTQRGRPFRERRERVRESDESSGPDDDDFPRPTPMTYRHVEAPEPPAQRSDVLVEMLQNATITPPRAQCARGRPSQRHQSSVIDTPSHSYPRLSSSDEDSEEGLTKCGGRRMTEETLNGGGPSLYGSELKHDAEYDWMT